MIPSAWPAAMTVSHSSTPRTVRISAGRSGAGQIGEADGPAPGQRVVGRERGDAAFKADAC